MRLESLTTLENETVIIYQTWFESSALLGPDKQVDAMMKIIRYGLYGELPDYGGDKMLEAVMMTWLAQVDAQKKKRKGGAPVGNQNAKGNKGGTGRPKKTQPKNTNLNVKVNGNANGNGNSNDNTLPAVDASAAIGRAEDATSEAIPDWARDDDE